MFSWIRISSASLFFCALLALPLQAQNTEQLEVGPPPLHRVDPPPPEARPEELEARGDELRGQKDFLDSVDYYGAALKGESKNAAVLNKIGICQLMMQHYKEAKKSFERSIRADRKHADAYNNLGVTYYATHNFNASIKEYDKAVALDGEAASYYSNMGTAYFGKRQFDKAIQCYARAVQLDPDIFDRTSHAGVQAKLPSPGDRAHYDYVMAKMYAKAGVNDRRSEEH